MMQGKVAFDWRRIGNWSSNCDRIRCCWSQSGLSHGVEGEETADLIRETGANACS